MKIEKSIRNLFVAISNIINIPLNSVILKAFRNLSEF